MLESDAGIPQEQGTGTAMINTALRNRNAKYNPISLKKKNNHEGFNSSGILFSPQP